MKKKENFMQNVATLAPALTLIATDAGVDLPVPSLPALPDDVRIRQERPRHGHEVGAPARQNRFDGRRGVDPVRGAQRHGNDLLVAQLLRREGEGTPGDARGDGRYIYMAARSVGRSVGFSSDGGDDMMWGKREGRGGRHTVSRVRKKRPPVT